MNGAPYDVFLSADQERPARLHADGICLQPFAYARGRAVLWSRKEAVIREATWLAAAKSEEAKRIALANPELAPYGMVLLPVLNKAFSRAELKEKLVYGQNVAQAFQFAATGAVDASFTSLSFALSKEGRKGRYWELPATADVDQWGCIRAASQQRAAAEKFVQVLQSARVKELLNTNGYH
jgi:molybdate transport system substrate-binding protein